MSIVGLKKFSVAVLKLALGIFGAGILLAITVWGFQIYQERSEEAANRPLTIPKTWPEVKVGALGNATFRLQTVWRKAYLKGDVDYQFEVEGYPPILRYKRKPGAEPAFTITFLDKDGFKTDEQRLPIENLSTVVGADSEPTGLAWNGNSAMDADTYRRSTRWEIQWSGFPQPSSATEDSESGDGSKRHGDGVPQAVKPLWTDISRWRLLSKGISKEEVRKTLGEPSKIVELGFETIWHYNYPFGGSATFDNQGKLESWTEP